MNNKLLVKILIPVVIVIAIGGIWLYKNADTVTTKQTGLLFRAAKTALPKPRIRAAKTILPKPQSRRMKISSWKPTKWTWRN